MDITLYKGSEEYKISVLKSEGMYLIYTPGEFDCDGAPINGAYWTVCSTIEEVNMKIVKLMIKRELSFVPEDL